MTTQKQGIHLKVARAMEHLFHFDDRLHEYLDADPIKLVRLIDHELGVTHIAVQVTRDPPPELGVLVGDVVHQLRSAVDHIAYGLVIAAGNVPTRQTSFPICATRPESLRVRGGVSQEALAKVDEVQPYHRNDPQAHPLHVLNQLWNADKHRVLLLTMLRSKDTQVFLTAPSGTLLSQQFQSVTTNQGQIIGSFPITEDAMDDSWEIQASGRSYLALDDSGPESWPNELPVQILLEELLEYVARVLLPKFDPLLS